MKITCVAPDRESRPLQSTPQEVAPVTILADVRNKNVITKILCIPAAHTTEGKPNPPSFPIPENSVGRALERLIWVLCGMLASGGPQAPSRQAPEPGVTLTGGQSLFVVPSFGWRAALRRGPRPRCVLPLSVTWLTVGSFAHRHVAVVGALICRRPEFCRGCCGRLVITRDVLGRPALVLSRSNRVLTLRRIL